MDEALILEDKRRLTRRQLIYYLKVVDDNSGQILGRLVDIHKEGLMIITEIPPHISEGYQLNIELPKALAEEVRVPCMSVRAQSVWIRPGLNPMFLEAGFKFLELSPANFRLLEQLLKKFEMPQTD